MTIDAFRLMLHVLGVTVWLGGQIVMMALVPILRQADVEGLTAKAAQGFQKVAWPAFGLIFVTGIWNVLAVGTGASVSFQMKLGIKILLVALSGGAAFVHSRTGSVKLRGITGGIGFVAALAAFVLGYALQG